MLNQERVREMTKMAIFDKNEGERCKPMVEYFRKDYVSMELLKSFVTGTAAFLLMAGIWVMYNAQELLEGFGTADMQMSLTVLAFLYILFMGVYFFITYLVYNGRYTAGRQEVKKFYTCLKKVNKLYQTEEQL